LCGGVLLDTIVNFGDYLPAKPLKLARDNAKKADLCLALGSSLTIPPASTIPESVGKKKNANLVICNLQETDMDPLSSLRVFSKADDLMIRVMAHLDIPIPTFILRRRLVVEMETKDETRHQLKIYGVDVDGTPATFLQSVKLAESRRVARAEPFLINFRDELESGKQLKLELEFMGHYGEPNLVICHGYEEGRDTQALHLLEYNPHTGEWKTSNMGSVAAAAVPDVSIIDLTEDSIS
jgi:mono-ADP-ribosyltransferase sirtuin 6